MKTALLCVLMCLTAFAKTATRDQSIKVAADGEVKERVAFVDGTSRVSRLFTNYILVSDSNSTLLLTINCEVNWTWQHCFTLQKGEAYTARFEYHYSAKKRDVVTITGQPKGNLTTPQTMKSAIVDFKELK